MARTRTKESRDPSDPIVRVRGGQTGVRFIALSSWKAEIKERKERKLAHTAKSKHDRDRFERKEKLRKANEQ